MSALHKIGLPLAILTASALLTGLMIRTRPRPELAAPEVPLPLVRAIPLTPVRHRFLVHSQGTVTPRTEIDLVAEVAGRIVHLAPSFRSGGLFQKNELLVAIDPTDYELAVTHARATLAQAESALVREEAEARVAREEWELNGRGSPNPLVLREPQLAQARAAVESARAGLQAALRDLERCRLTAPFDGRVRTQHVDVGQFVTRGQTLGRIYSVDSVEVRLPLALDDLAFLDLPLAMTEPDDGVSGPAVTLSARIGGQTHTWQGRIVRTEGEVDTRTRMLHAVARVDRPYDVSPGQPPLAVGLFVRATIHGREVEPVYLAPRKAFRYDRDLMVVDRENRLRLRQVEILRREPDQMVFRAALAPGDRVCVTPLEAVTDGMQVRVLDEAVDHTPPTSGATPQTTHP